MQVDTIKTQEFYLTQNKIIDDCSCADCRFYATTIIKENFEIFRILKSAGVDLKKNLSTEPTGVWCIRDDDGSLLCCQQVYQTFGKLLNNVISKFKYEMTENGFNVTAIFLPTDSGKIDIDLTIVKP